MYDFFCIFCSCVTNKDWIYIDCNTCSTWIYSVCYKCYRQQIFCVFMCCNQNWTNTYLFIFTWVAMRGIFMCYRHKLDIWCNMAHYTTLQHALQYIDLLQTIIRQLMQHNTLQHTATHRNMHCNTLQHALQHIYALQTRIRQLIHYDTLQLHWLQRTLHHALQHTMQKIPADNVYVGCSAQCITCYITHCNTQCNTCRLITSTLVATHNVLRVATHTATNTG